MTDNIHKAVWDWLLTCPHIGDLFFNAGRAMDGNTILVPSEQVVSEYTDGSKLREYIAALTRFEPFSKDPNDTENIETQLDMDAVGDWIAAQNTLPVLPTGYTLCDIDVMPNQSGYIVANDENIAKYQLQFKITYIR